MIRANDLLAVYFHAGQGHDFRPGCDHDVGGSIFLFTDGDFVLTCNFTSAFDIFDLVFFKQHLNAAGQAFDDFVFLGHHGFQVQLWLRIDTDLGKMLVGIFKFVTELQQ